MVDLVSLIDHAILHPTATAADLQDGWRMNWEWPRSA